MTDIPSTTAQVKPAAAIAPPDIEGAWAWDGEPASPPAAVPKAIRPVAERVYLDNRHYRVTDRLLIFGPKTFALAHLVSLTRYHEDPNPLPALFAFLGGAGLVILGLAVVAGAREVGWVVLALGVGARVLGYALLKSGKPTHRLTLVSSSAERYPLANRDVAAVDRVERALQRAIDDFYGRRCDG